MVKKHALPTNYGHIKGASSSESLGISSSVGEELSAWSQLNRQGHFRRGGIYNTCNIHVHRVVVIIDYAMDPPGGSVSYTNATHSPSTSEIDPMYCIFSEMTLF